METEMERNEMKRIRNCAYVIVDFLAFWFSSQYTKSGESVGESDDLEPEVI